MTDHITDRYEFTVEVIQHGELAIANVEFPSPVEPGQEFVVAYDIINNGERDTCFGYIGDLDNVDEDGNPTVIANTRWQDTIPAGSEKHVESTITGRATDLHAVILAGYYTE